MVTLTPDILKDFTTGILTISIALGLHLLLFIIGSISVLRSQKSTLTKINWIVFQFLFPLIGFIIYFAIGRERIPKLAYPQMPSTLVKPSQQLESVFKTPEGLTAKSVTIGTPEETKAKPEAIYDQQKAIEMSSKLKEAIYYVKSSLERGFSLEKIKEALRKVGWKEEDISKAIEEARKTAVGQN
ncbi:PLDc_N domain-containing protein [Candidatus Woesearchaeota archaeon]|nr:PLDc_N domain-containing protein [Candidatus Woesearchaeota archaeon]